MKSKVYFYNDYSDDFFKDDKEYKLKSSYKWIRNDIYSKVLSFLVYLVALVVSFFYCYFVLRMKIIGKKNLRKIKKGGYFIYSNHTQVVGDVFIAAHVAFPKRIYTIVGLDNYKLKFIGKILPFLGALPIGETYSQMKEFNKAVKERVKRHPIVIFPEAHVWPYYTKIRPFVEGSFKYPIKNDVASFSLTVTYKKTKIRKRPKMIVYLDGPFYVINSSDKEKELKDIIYNKMYERSLSSDFEYFDYIKKS